VTCGITNPHSAVGSEQQPHRYSCAAGLPPGIRNLTARGFPGVSVPILGGVRVAFSTTGTDTSLVGREAELSRLGELVAPPYAESRMLLLLGGPGMGKTVLLARAAREAKSAGMRVLSAAGRESEQDLAFAGLHQLLRPVLDRVDGLPA
jgi:AAA ATPase domain